MYIKATNWACSHRMISQPVFLFEILASHSHPPCLPPLSPHLFHSLGPSSWHKPRQLQSAEQPGSLLDSVASPQLLPWNAANGYYIKAEWLTGKSSLPQNCQSILPNHREREGKRETEMVVYFWVLRTAECQHLIPPQLPIFSFYFFLFYSSVLNPFPTHSNSPYTHTTPHATWTTSWFNLYTMLEKAACQYCFIPLLKVRM